MIPLSASHMAEKIDDNVRSRWEIRKVACFSSEGIEKALRCRAYLDDPSTLSGQAQMFARNSRMRKYFFSEGKADVHSSGM
jgi:hypothetical protein